MGSVKDILFLGLARNCARTIPNFFSFLGHLAERGVSSWALIGENGSRDRTRRLIEEDPVTELVDTGFMQGSPSRLQRMAMGREHLLQLAKRTRREPYVAVVDLDDVMLHPPHPASVLTAMGRLDADPKLFGIGATSYPRFYDLLALRAGGVDFSRMHETIEWAKRSPFTYYQFQKNFIYSNRRAFTSDQPIPCESTFNGFVLYRSDDYFLGSYRSSREDTVCEHATLNLRIGEITGKSMLIVPELKVKAPHEHAADTSFLRFWADRAVKLLRVQF